MSLNRETVNRINHFRRFEDLYQPNLQVQRLIGSRTLHMVVAPAVTGKTLVMRHAAELDSSYGRSVTLSTRKPRVDDEPGAFRLLEHSDSNIHVLLDKILSGELVQYKFHPTEHTFYGSEALDHPHEHNMLATLSGGINQLQHVGFEETTVIGLVSEPSTWSKRFDTRYPERHPQRLARLREAEISYSDLLVRDDVTWVVNEEGYPGRAAEKLIDPTASSNDADEAISYAQRILQLTHQAKIRTESIKHE